MKVLNTKIIEGLTAQEYFALPGLSYSTIKNNGRSIAPTARMGLGTDVHNYLGAPQLYKHENSELVKPLATALKQALGEELLPFLSFEVVVTADFCYEGFTMAYKGRFDCGIPGRLIIDFKVAENIRRTIDHFGYPFQLSGYALGAVARTAIIIAINPKTKKTDIINIPVTCEWWQTQVLSRGKI